MLTQEPSSSFATVLEMRMYPRQTMTFELWVQGILATCCKMFPDLCLEKWSDLICAPINPLIGMCLSQDVNVALELH